jgi:RimK family alpha-L-glutamate ligase
VRIGVVGSAANDGTVALVEGWARLGLETDLLTAAEARRALRPGDVCIARLDIRPELDGVEEGLLDLLLLERRGIDVRNTAGALLAAHDKLRTARLLHRSLLPHPATGHLRAGRPVPVRAPVVFKPRFGSWGRDVALCADDDAVASYLATVQDRRWFARHGVLVQEVLPIVGHDLRVLVAGGRVVGGIRRSAAPGEWRTNISIGGSSAPAAIPPSAAELAATAAAVADLDLAGVDLLPVGPDSWAVIEINGAVDFDAEYGFGAADVYAEAAAALGLTTAAYLPTPV